MTLHKDIAVLAFSLVIAAFSKVCYMPDCLHANLQSAVVLFLSRMTKRLAACLVPCSVCCREKRYYMQVLAVAGLRWCKCSLPMVQEQNCGRQRKSCGCCCNTLLISLAQNRHDMYLTACMQAEAQVLLHVPQIHQVTYCKCYASDSLKPTLHGRSSWPFLCIPNSSCASLLADDNLVGCLSCTLSVLQEQTVLHAGATSGSSEVVQMLLASGAKVDAVDNSVRLVCLWLCHESAMHMQA